MDIFITGSTGFVGRALCHELTLRGHQLRCLVRPGSEGLLLKSSLVRPVSANLLAPDQLAPLIKGADAVIHLVGIIREIPSRHITFARLHHKATISIVSATELAGVNRYLHMSANGTRKGAVSNYHQTKWLAEEVVRQSKLNWTIFRPSLIFGPEDQFINLIASLVRKLPLIPVMGDGEYRMQPVSIGLLVKGFALALERDKAIGKTYHCGGKDCLSYNKLLDLVGTALGKKSVHKIKQPLCLMRPVVAIMQHFPFFPMTLDQLQMLVEGNCCDTSEWSADLDLEPGPLSKDLEYITPSRKKPRQ